VDRSQVILIFLSLGYFKSTNCMRELLRAAYMKKPVAVLVEPEALHGSIPFDATRKAIELACTRFAANGLLAEMQSWNFAPPSADDLRGTLFATDVIEWNRIGAFQDVTCRLIAERLLGEGHAPVYVQGEMHEGVPLPAPSETGFKYHAYCSSLNPGSAELLSEVSAALEIQVAVSTDADALSQCMHMLIYLTSQTWTRGDESTDFAREVGLAMQQGVHLLLAHEMQSWDPTQNTRHGCDFDTFFACEDGTTDPTLLRAGIYHEIAVPLKGGAWREASLLMLAQALARNQRADGVCDDADDAIDAEKSLFRKQILSELNAKAVLGAHALGRIRRHLNRSSRHSSDSSQGVDAKEAPSMPRLGLRRQPHTMNAVSTTATVVINPAVTVDGP